MWPFGKREEQRAITQKTWGPGGSDSDFPGLPSSVTMDCNRALSLVPVFGAARLLADSIASLPPVLYTRDNKGIPRRQPTPALFNEPSIHGTLPDWLHRMVVSMALQGDAIGLKTRYDFYGFPTMVEWLNPERVVVQDAFLTGKGSYTDPMWWWWGRPIDPRTLVHIPWFTMPYKVRGLSPIEAFRVTASTGLSAEAYADQWFENGGVPPGTFRNSELTVSEDDATKITNRLVSKMRSRKPIVYGRDWTYEPITIKPHEAQFVETMRLTATNIAVIYGLPPHKLGGSTGDPLTYTSTEQDALDYLIFSLRPWLVRGEAALSKLFPPQFYVKFDTSELLRTDALTRAQVDQISLGNMAYRTPDEVRADHDWGPMPKPVVVAPVTPPAPPPMPNQPGLNGNSPQNGQNGSQNGQNRSINEIITNRGRPVFLRDRQNI